jgi:hypothetical protein
MSNSTEDYEKTAICRISFDGYDWRNKITIQSPSGKRLSFQASWGAEVPEDLKELFTKWNNYWSSATFGSGEQHFDEELTYEMMEKIKNFSNK